MGKKKNAAEGEPTETPVVQVFRPFPPMCSIHSLIQLFQDMMVWKMMILLDEKIIQKLDVENDVEFGLKT